MEDQLVAQIRSEGSYADGTDRQFLAIDKNGAANLPYVEGGRVRIQMAVGGQKFVAGLRTTPRQSIVYVAADLETQAGKPARLSEVLSRRVSTGTTL